MLNKMNTVQAFYFGAFVQAIKCAKESEGELSHSAFVKRMGERVDVSTTPARVQAAYAYYYENVERQDWGGVSVYKVMIGGISTYAVHTTCDGDEEWLDLYNEYGNDLGFAAIYVDEFEYIEKLVLRSIGIGE